jgi:hypothetical protein
VIIGGWTELFFRKRLLGTGTMAASAMTVGIAALVATAWKVDWPAEASVIPLARIREPAVGRDLAAQRDAARLMLASLPLP